MKIFVDDEVVPRVAFTTDQPPKETADLCWFMMAEQREAIFDRQTQMQRLRQVIAASADVTDEEIITLAIRAFEVARLVKEVIDRIPGEIAVHHVPMPDRLPGDHR